MTTPLMKPYHIHDCTKCVYLGSTTVQHPPVDWYRCNDSVIGRHGSGGPEYWSSLVTLVCDDRYLVARDSTGYADDGPRDVLVGMNILARFMLQWATKPKGETSKSFTPRD